MVIIWSRVQQHPSPHKHTPFHYAFCAAAPAAAAPAAAAATAAILPQERYSGLAQIAETYFQSPKISPVELLLFEDPSCFGVLWAGPMDTFSFFVRQVGLP